MCSRETRIAASTTAAWARLKPRNGAWLTSCTLAAAEARALRVLDHLHHLDLAVRQCAGQPPAATRSAGNTGQSRRRLVTQPANTRTSVV